MTYQISEEERQRRSDRMKAINGREGSLNPAELAKITVRRFSMTDIEALGAWLTERLRDKWPHLTDRHILGWLRGCMESREFLFLRAENATGLAEIVHDPLSPVPRIREVFVLCRKGFQHEGAAIYTHFKRWAESMRAGEIEVLTHSDVPNSMVKDVIGNPLRRETMVIKL